MGHKVHPKGIRLGYIKDWDSKWFNLRDMPVFIEEDHRIRTFLRDRLKLAAVSRIGIERRGAHLNITVFTARPGVVIGKKGADIDGLRSAIEAMSHQKTAINVMEIKRPELDAQLVSEGIAMQLEKQVSFRRAMRRVMERAMQGGALGIKCRVSGRLGGAEIARVEWMMEGRVPLQTFRADIDYGFSEAHITMGRIGCKVWIFRKELFRKTDADLMEDVRKIEKEKEELAEKAAGVDALAGLGEDAGKPDEVEIIEEKVLKELGADEEALRRRSDPKRKD